VVSIELFSALIINPPAVAPAGELIAPQPATSRASKGAAGSMTARLILRTTAPYGLTLSNRACDKPAPFSTPKIF
jgi:hypothetical protein